MSHLSASARRSGFALTGRSVAIDPRHDAVRGDLADVRLAQRVFAPHYVLPVSRVLDRVVDLREGATEASPALSHLEQGTRFDLLDITGATAWGIAQPSGLVGYLPADALAPTTTVIAA